MRINLSLALLLLILAPLSYAMSSPPPAAVGGYDRLSAYTGTHNTNILLEIWGKEAAENIVNRSVGVDRSAPIFNSSYDWHSSVHGHFAATYAGTARSNADWVSTAVNQYTASSVQSELYYNVASLEHTYGYPWLMFYASYLKDVQPQAYDTLQPLVTKTYNASYQRLMDATENDYLASISSGYRNLNFTACGVYRYAKKINDTARMNAIKTKIAGFAVSVNWDEVQNGDFFDSKAIALMAYKAMGITGSAWNDLMQAYANTQISIPSDLSNYGSHAKGSVISGAWGYWLMYQQTNQTKYYNAFVQSVDVLFKSLKAKQYDSGYFKGDGHWLPHFGVIALMLSKGDVSF